MATESIAIGIRAFVVLLQLPSWRYHPCYYQESPLPGHPDHLWRFKSGGHHTEGFVDLEDAKRMAVELGATLHGYEHPFRGRVDCPPDRVLMDDLLITDDPLGVIIMRPFGEEHGRTFVESFRMRV